MTKPRVLIVDDTRTTQYLHRALLEAEGYDVDLASSGREALDRIPEYRPDLVLMDVMMPGIDGIECCRRIRRDGHLEETKIMMVTSATEYSRISEAFAAGCDDYITKPVDRDELVQKARDLLRFAQIKRMLRST